MVAMHARSSFSANAPSSGRWSSSARLAVSYTHLDVYKRQGILSSAVFFRADAYSKLITTETGDFATDVTEISFDQIPMLDSASANVLTNRKLGELSDLVSQFEVDATSAQINYKNRCV